MTSAIRCSTKWAMKLHWKKVKSEFNVYPWYEESEMMCMRFKAYDELRIRNRSEIDFRKREQLTQLQRKPRKNSEAWTGFEPMTAAIPVRCSIILLAHLSDGVKIMKSKFVVLPYPNYFDCLAWRWEAATKFLWLWFTYMPIKINKIILIKRKQFTILLLLSLPIFVQSSPAPRILSHMPHNWNASLLIWKLVASKKYCALGLDYEVCDSAPFNFYRIRLITTS